MRRPLVTCLVLLAACVDPATETHCTFGTGHAVAEVDLDGRRDTALVSNATGATMIWTDGAGTWARPLSLTGAPTSPPRRLGPPCTGGVDAVPETHGMRVACLRPAFPQAHKLGGVTVLWLDNQQRVVARRSFGEAGPGSQGVAMADDGTLAWHDGQLGLDRIWIARVERGTDPEPWVASRAGVIARDPATCTAGGHFAWSETVARPGRPLVGEVVVSSGARSTAPVTIATVLEARARPTVHCADEVTHVAFTDRVPARSRPALFVQRLTAEGEPDDAPRRAGRADAAARATLLACDDRFLSLVPHRYGSRDVVVGIRTLPTSASDEAREWQIYEPSARLSSVRANCVGDRTLITFLDERRDQTAPSLRATTLACAARSR